MVFSNTPLDLTGKTVWVAGHNGLVGSAVCRALRSEDCKLLSVSKAKLDLRRQEDVGLWMDLNRPDVVVLAAARVGGIKANDAYPADFLYDNLMIEANVIHAAAKFGVEKLLFLGSSCIYPRDAAQPIREEALLTAPLEETNQWYALAKIAGVKLCEAYRKQQGCNFISAMPCNLYGPDDRFDLERSHVIPALMMKIHAAKRTRAEEVHIWGTGNALREFLYADDLADALVYLLKHYNGAAPVNIGSGEEISIRDLAGMICEVAGFKGLLVFDPSMPDGTPRKLLDSARLREQGWTPQTSLRSGLETTYKIYAAMEQKRAA